MIMNIFILIHAVELIVFLFEALFVFISIRKCLKHDTPAKDASMQ